MQYACENMPSRFRQTYLDFQKEIVSGDLLTTKCHWSGRELGIARLMAVLAMN
jgi:hypothetical protein